MHDKIHFGDFNFLSSDGKLCTEIIFNNIELSETGNIQLPRYKNHNIDRIKYFEFTLFQNLPKIKPELQYFVALNNSVEQKNTLVKIASNHSACETFVKNVIKFIRINNVTKFDLSNVFGAVENEKDRFYLNKLIIKIKEKFSAIGYVVNGNEARIANKPKSTTVSPKEISSKFFIIKAEKYPHD